MEVKWLKTANNAVIGQVFQSNHFVMHCIGQSHTFTFLIFLYTHTHTHTHTHTNSDVLLKFSVSFQFFNSFISFQFGGSTSSQWLYDLAYIWDYAVFQRLLTSLTGSICTSKDNISAKWIHFSDIKVTMAIYK